MKTKLLPCAHCGSDDVHLVREVRDNVVSWRVMCRTCGMSTEAYPEKDYDEDVAYVEHDKVVELMDASTDCAVTVWNTRAESCAKSSACLDLEDKSNDELVAIAKECQDVLGRKAMRLLERIRETIEEDSDE